MDRIMDVAKKSQADAIHPGYGFLSENSQFVSMCETEGITFIGPPKKAMNDLGDKINSKKIAKDAGVSLVPGFIGEVHSNEEVIKISREIGYPVMIKASAGGGGKGMRIAWNDEEALEGFRLSKQEAKSSFGDDRILIEKFIDNPRHIEFQVLCDGFGNGVYLPERECSIQRRNQKVVEEAPSPFITPEVRKKMGEQAVALALAVGYKNTGTVEFLVDKSHGFYFLEMNTRLQVEHPITEEVTGIDIVEHMIRVAAGEKLSITQKDVEPKGWAIESRVYAEDPLRNFLPSIGRLTKYKEPVEYDNKNWIRTDSGIEEGSEISMYYDPMISKLITYGENRGLAIDRMKYALDSYVVHGVNHNVSFLRDVMNNEKFISGDFSTKFIAEEYKEGFHGHVLTETERLNLLVTTAALHVLRMDRDRSIGVFKNSKLPSQVSLSLKLESEEQPVQIDVEKTDKKTLTCQIGGTRTTVNLDQWKLESDVVLANVNQSSEILQIIDKYDLGYVMQYVGTQYKVEVLSLKERELIQHMPIEKEEDQSTLLKSPMAGHLISVAVKEGDVVHIGQELAVVEAMKMQNVLRSACDGVVKKIHKQTGTSVQLDDMILEFEIEDVQQQAPSM